SGGASTLVAPHPIPGDQKERRIGDEVEQIIEPAMRIITGPTVQFGLDLPYPTLRPNQRELRFIGVHQRPPGIPASFLPTCWPPSPCTRLSRARTTTGPPPHRVAIGRQRTCPPPERIPEGWATTDGSQVHCTPVRGLGARLCPGSIASGTPQAFPLASFPA